MTYFQTLMLSIFVHMILGIFLWKMPFEKPNPNEITVDFIPFKKNDPNLIKNQQIVRATTPHQNELIESEKMARFLSDKKQRVKNEVHAKQSGLSKNSENTNNNRLVEENSYKRLHKLGLSIPSMVPHQNSSNKKKFSTTGEYLPKDIGLSDFNALNTDKFIYYTYYSRIEEQIRHHWETYVYSILNKYQSQKSFPKVIRPWITKVEILLDHKGYYKKSIIHSTSGIQDIDLASSHAFEHGSPIPNPPKEMIQKDGYVHLNYQFVVNWY